MRAFRRMWAAATVAGLVVLMACGGGDAERQPAGEQEAGEMAPQETPAPGGQEGQEGEAPEPPQDADLPEGVTPEMVQEGQQVFVGDGLCYACHGQEGTGLPNLGADLTDGEWIHIDGSYESIIENINTGVTAEESTSGTPMPPRGGSQITDEQVRAVAAYVYTISRGGQ